MKNNILRLAISAVLFAGLTFAQGGRRPAGAGDQLGLSEDQKPQVQAILKEQREARTAARKNNASKEDLQAIQQKTRDRLSTVLNADQLQKFDAASKRTQRGRRGAKELNLSEDQKPQVQSIFKEQREAFAAARKNNAPKEDLKAIHQKTHDRLSSVLSADQMQMFDAGSKRMQKGRRPLG